ncbi:MAG: hypothetical protein ACPL06_01255 [Candidatus Anstonellales archaeon]
MEHEHELSILLKIMEVLKQYEQEKITEVEISIPKNYPIDENELTTMARSLLNANLVIKKGGTKLKVLSILVR